MVECPVRKTDLKSQSRSTYLVPRLHRLLVIAESTDGLLGNLFELEDLGATAGAGNDYADRDGDDSAVAERPAAA